jgi:hypothetical protein
MYVLEAHQTMIDPRSNRYYIFYKYREHQNPDNMLADQIWLDREIVKNVSCCNSAWHRSGIAFVKN